MLGPVRSAAAAATETVRGVVVASQAHLLHVTGHNRGMSLVRGGDAIHAARPTYALTNTWGTFHDPADRHGAVFAHMTTTDDENLLLSGPVYDIGTEEGVDVETCLVRAFAPTLTTSTQWYLAQQSTDATTGKDWAILLGRDGLFRFEWFDSGDDYCAISFRPQFPPDPENYWHKIRASARYSGGTLSVWMWQKLDHDGPWLSMEPEVAGKMAGADATGTLAGIQLDGTRRWTIAQDPLFVTRTDGMATGFGRGLYAGSMIIRDPAADPYTTPGTIAHRLDLADGADSIPGDTFSSNGDTWTMPDVGERDILANPSQAGWFMSAHASADTSQTFDHADLPALTGDFTVVARITPHDQDAGDAYYLKKVATPFVTAGILIADARAAAFGHIAAIHDGTNNFAVSGMTVTDGTPLDIIMVVDRANDELRVYRNGVLSGSAVDISTCGAITNTEDLIYSGGELTTTITHLGTGIDFTQAWTAAQITAYRDHMGWA